jgi:hypothetical protein
MFRLNLYPEAEEKRRARLARTGATALVTLLVAVTVALTLFHAGSGFVMADRARDLAARRAGAEREAAALAGAEPAKEMALLRARLRARADRVVWSPKLAEMSRLLPPPLVLDNIMVAERGKGQAIPALAVHGSVLQGSVRDPVPAIVSYVTALKESAVFTEGIASVELASVSTDNQSGITSFHVVCPLVDAPPQEKAP